MDDAIAAFCMFLGTIRLLLAMFLIAFAMGPGSYAMTGCDTAYNKYFQYERRCRGRRSADSIDPLTTLASGLVVSNANELEGLLFDVEMNLANDEKFPPTIG